MENVSTNPVTAGKPRVNGNLLSSKDSTKTFSPTVQKTLNGYDKLTALQMISDFAGNYMADVRPKSLNAWYSLDEIKNINDLLLAEAQVRPTDGVRFYFGCNPPPAGTTELTLSIFMVSTETRTAVGTQSNHGDYYDHVADFLSTGTTGAAVNNDAANSLAGGATLYNGTAPANDLCGHPGQHYLDTNTVYAWVSKRCENSGAHDNTALNTKSEWFPLCFITSIFSSIVKGQASSGLDGLRIYLGKGYVDKDGLMRDVFILVPTKAGDNGTHIDYYSCLEDLLQSSFCGDFTTKSARAIKFPAREIHIQNFRRAVNAKSFWEGGGYDNGELCPTYCN